MMKKVLYGVAMAFVALLTIGSLQSCKDDLSDLRLQTEFDVANLQDQLNRKESELRDSITAHRNVLNKLLKDLNDYATVEYVKGEVAKLLKADSIMADTLNNKINGAITRIELLDTLAHNNYNRILKLNGRVGAIEASIGTIRDTLQLWKERMDIIGDSANANYRKLVYVMTRIDGIKDTVQNIYDTLFNEGGVFDRIETLENRVDSIDAKFVNLFNRFDALITGILIQGVKSPVFGDFNLPIGVKSNMLFNYYGENAIHDSFKFPSAESTYSASGEDVKLPTGVTFTNLGLPTNQIVTIPEGCYSEEISLGEVYVTLNPIGHVFNDTPLTLQNSQGKPLPIEIRVNPSDELLTFGYHEGTRGTIESGLYSGKAILKVANEDGTKSEDLKEVEFKLDESFVRSIKDAVSGPSKSTALGVLKAVYEQLGSKKIPAYALRYDWSVDEPVYDLEAAAGSNGSKEYAVLSQYDLAVVAAKPYGFNTFDNVGGSSKQLPIIGHIDNFVSELIDRSLNNFDLKGKNITIEGKEIGFGSVEFGKTDDGNNITATVEGLTVDGKTVNVTVAPFNDPDKAVEVVTAAIVDAINTEINPNHDKAIEASINSKVDLVLLQMQAQINEVVEGISGQITDTFKGMGNDTDKYFDKLNRAAKIYDRVASKINNFLKNPKAYLQACAFYNCNGSMGIVSNNIKSPTPFVVKGGDKLDLYLSTYTAELIAPAYKKYVAVVAKYDPKDLTKPVKGPLGNINKGENINKVISGSEIEVSFNVGDFQKGYIYEFYYQAVDYCGYTSTKKFYIKVN